MDRCMDCGTDVVLAGEYYMVHDAVWNRMHNSKGGQLCVSCAEARLGRRLAAADFTNCILNRSAAFSRSERLQHRLNQGK